MLSDRAAATSDYGRFLSGSSYVHHEEYLQAMSKETDPVELLDSSADEQLLAGGGQLPSAVGRPEPVVTSRNRRRIVGVGATLTGATLIGGIVLFVVGAVQALVDGSLASLATLVRG